MRITIFYASYGGGHLNAAKSIHKYLEENYKNIEIELIDCMKYVNLTLEKITTTAYREMAKKAPWAWGRIYNDSQKGPLAHISSRSNKIMAIKLLKLLREKQPDIIISTHPFGSQMCSYLKRKGKINSKIATIMTDFAPHDQWLVGNKHTNYFFVAHNKMKDYLISKNINENKIFVTGIPISERFLINFEPKEIFNQLKLKKELKTILFFGGGEFGLGKTKTTETFEDLVHNIKNIQIIAIAGKNEKMKKKFLEIVEKEQKQDTVKILEFTDKIPELMRIADLVITKPGGMTTSESLASHLPMIIINPIPGQEEENAKFLEDMGIAIWIKKEDNPKEKLEEIFANQEKLETMKKNTYLLAKEHATEEICKTIINNN